MNENKVNVILVTGMPGSGKEEFIRVCQNKRIRVIRMGDFVREETRRQGLDLTDENVGGVAQNMRERHGFDIWARRTIEAIGDEITVEHVRLAPDFMALHLEPGDQRFQMNPQVLQRARLADLGENEEEYDGAESAADAVEKGQAES